MVVKEVFTDEADHYRSKCTFDPRLSGLARICVRAPVFAGRQTAGCADNGYYPPPISTNLPPDLSLTPPFPTTTQTAIVGGGGVVAEGGISAAPLEPLMGEGGIAASGGEMGEGGISSDIHVQQAPPNTNLVIDGSFTIPGAPNWSFWNTTQDLGIGGLLRVARNMNTPNGGFFQTVGHSVNSGNILELTLTLGNDSIVPKTISLVLRNSDWTDVHTCTFGYLPRATTMSTERMRVRTNLNWSSIVLQGWLNEPDSTLGVMVSNIDLRYKPDLINEVTSVGTDCISSFATNIVSNWDFNRNLTDWEFFGSARAHVVNGALQIRRESATGDSGLSQTLAYQAGVNQTLDLSLVISNISSNPKTINVIMRERNWDDIINCWFTIPPNTAQQQYYISGVTTRAWNPIVLQGWLPNGDSIEGLRLDNFRVLRRATALPRPTQCSAPSPIDTLEEIVAELATYNVIVYPDGVGNPRNNWSWTWSLRQSWQFAELREVLAGVQNTAQSFTLLRNSANPSGVTPQAKLIFNSVMGRIEVLRVQNGFTYGVNDPCMGTFNQGCTNNGFAAVGFYGGVNVTQYTMVHELGHRFNNQSDRLVNGQPSSSLAERLSPGVAITDCNGERVLGELGGEWERGARGWGSGPALITTTTPLITDFQQNPRTAPGIVSAEIDEATADMFLNWIYRRNASNAFTRASCTLIPTPAPDTWLGPGFLNRDWRGLMSQTALPGNLDSTLPGDARNWWMQNQMRQIFDVQSWQLQ